MKQQFLLAIALSAIPSALAEPSRTGRLAVLARAWDAADPRQKIHILDVMLTADSTLADTAAQEAKRRSLQQIHGPKEGSRLYEENLQLAEEVGAGLLRLKENALRDLRISVDATGQGSTLTPGTADWIREAQIQASQERERVREEERRKRVLGVPSVYGAPK